MVLLKIQAKRWCEPTDASTRANQHGRQCSIRGLVGTPGRSVTLGMAFAIRSGGYTRQPFSTFTTHSRGVGTVKRLLISDAVASFVLTSRANRETQSRVLSFPDATLNQGQTLLLNPAGAAACSTRAATARQQ
jgi:hypothetical protein